MQLRQKAAPGNSHRRGLPIVMQALIHKDELRLHFSVWTRQTPRGVVTEPNLNPIGVLLVTSEPDSSLMQLMWAEAPRYHGYSLLVYHDCRHFFFFFLHQLPILMLYFTKCTSEIWPRPGHLVPKFLYIWYPKQQRRMYVVNMCKHKFTSHLTSHNSSRYTTHWWL